MTYGLKFLRNKKGTVFDNVGILVGVFIFAIIIIIMTIFIARFTSHDTFQNDPQAKQVADAGQNMFQRTGDNLVLMVFFGLTAIALISAILSRANLIFAFVTVLMVMVLIFLSVGFSNAWEEFAGNSIVASEGILHYPKTDFILRNLPIISVAASLLIGIVLFASLKARGSSGT